MTELAIPDQQTAAVDLGQDPVARLAGWVDTARAAHQIATSLCKTAFVPAQYRGNPDEAAAAILAGAELGIPGPLAALRAFHPINGTPTLSALAMRAIVQSRGHDVQIVSSDETRAVVRGRRHGITGHWQSSTWTIERATVAGYVGGKNPNWKTNPTAMLVARATSEVCRWVASDAIMGMPYSAEELQDEQVPAITAAPATRRLSAADLDDPAPPTSDEDRRGVFHQIEQTAGLCGFATPDGACDLPAGHPTGPELDGYDGHDVVNGDG